MGRMRLWLARRPEVSLREQLITEVTLGILCGELGPGQRHPSTRELARRFHLHPNTVSAGYRQLEREGWVEFRRGSGVYVRGKKLAGPPSPAVALDQLIADFFGVALAAFLEPRACAAGRRRVPSQSTGFSRRAKTELAPRPRGNRSGGLRLRDGGGAAENAAPGDLPRAVRILDSRFA